MRFVRLGNLHWYDLVLLPLIALVVYPDRVATWFTETTGRKTNWLHAMALSLGSLLSAGLFVEHFQESNPGLTWTRLGLTLAALALIRALMAGVKSLFGFDE